MSNHPRNRAEVRARKQAALRRSGSGFHGMKSRRSERRKERQSLRQELDR